MTDALRDYQLVARDYLRERGRAGLFLDMGLGKTATCLAAIEERHLPVFVTAPKRVAETVWPAEARRWRPDLRVVLAKGDPAARGAVLRDEDADVVVLGRENLHDLPSLRRRRSFNTVILDELSGFKSRGVRWNTIRRLTTDPDVNVWGLTGTPAANGYLDLWPQIYLLDNGKRLGRGVTSYRDNYFRPTKWLPNGIVTTYELREGAEEAIKAKLEDLCLYMGTEGRVELPPITFNDVAVELPESVRKVYRRLKDELLVDLKEVFGGEVVAAMSPSALTSKLSQITAGFIFSNDTDLNGGEYTWLHDEKINVTKEIIEGTGSPVMVFYQFVPEKKRLVEALPQARTIDEPGVIDAWNQGEVPVLVAHPASAGHGLNLQHGGYTQVWPSPTWDLEFWEQGYKRVWRSGQTTPVVIHSILANRSIDHLIRARQTGKADLQNGLLAHLESPI